jgi:hypothetical protein
MEEVNPIKYKSSKIIGRSVSSVGDRVVTLTITVTCGVVSDTVINSALLYREHKNTEQNL